MKKLFTIALVLVLSLMVVGSALANGGTITSKSNQLNFSGTGWGGHSCPPSHPIIVSGKVTNTKGGEPLFPLGISKKANPADSQYPVYPHYTYGSWYAGETGWVVQNGGTAQSLFITITCRMPSVDVGASLRCSEPDSEGTVWQLIAGVTVDPANAATLTFDGVDYTASQGFHTNFGTHVWSAVANRGFYIPGPSSGSLTITRSECNEPGGPDIHVGTGPGGQPINLPLMILIGLIGVSALSAGAVVVKRSRQ